MCGFVGQFAPKGPDQQTIRTASELLKHRGPDDTGEYFDVRIGIGFRRLSIIDLSPAGHQPMSDASGRWRIVFNGEIYNYRELRGELQSLGVAFRSHSDTEVILQAYQKWGTGCFAKMNGMWAIALWDRTKGELILCRDRFGEKPLYYTKRGDELLFASEMKALFPFLPKRPEPNEQIVFDYLTFAFHDHTNETFFHGIKQLRPGHFATIRNGTFNEEPYWALQPNPEPPKTFSGAAERFRELFFDSVRLRLRSDVPIGSCLSGGLDSSSIVLVANRLVREEHPGFRWQTFTACSRDRRYDERQYSQEVNRLVDADANEVFPEPKTFREDMKRILWHQEEPFLSLSIFAQWEIMKRARSRGIKVLLDGQGGDEVLAGYLPFFASFLADALRRGNLTRFIGQGAAFFRTHRASLGDILPTFALYALPRTIGRWMLRRSVREEFTALEPSFRRQYFRPPDLPSPFSGQLKNHMFRLLTGTGIRALLHYEDRNAMAFSIESRVPFLDHRLAELTLAMPDSFLLHSGETKRVLRLALRDIVPRTILDRRDKMGFVVPQAEWMARELAFDLRATLTRPSRALSRYVKSEAVEDALTRFFSGETRLYGILWRWYNLETWFQTFYG